MLATITPRATSTVPVLVPTNRKALKCASIPFQPINDTDVVAVPRKGGGGGNQRSMRGNGLLATASRHWVAATSLACLRSRRLCCRPSRNLPIDCILLSVQCLGPMRGCEAPHGIYACLSMPVGRLLPPELASGTQGGAETRTRL
jgi:hypothetical protein